MQQADHLEADHVVKIIDHKIYQKTGAVKVHLSYESVSKEYEDYKSWEALDMNVLEDCKDGKDGEDLSKNLLVIYAKSKKDMKLYTKTAELAGQEDVLILFPDFVKPVEEDEDSSSSEEELTEKCTADHSDYSELTYKAVEGEYYFLKNRKLHGLLCRVCGLDYTGWKDKPGTNTPAYTCEKMALGKCICEKGLVCHSCYQKEQLKLTDLAAGGRRSRHRCCQANSQD